MVRYGSVMMRLQDADMGLVAGVERLVGEQEHAVAQMGVEVAGQVLGVADGEAVLAEQILHGARQDAFAGAFDAAQHDGDFALLFRVLHDVGHPVHAGSRSVRCCRCR